MSIEAGNILRESREQKGKKKDAPYVKHPYERFVQVYQFCYE